MEEAVTTREIEYVTQRGMVEYFMNLLSLPRGEVWAVIKEACFVCVDRLDNNGACKSWCYAKVPNSDHKLRIDVYVHQSYNYQTNKREGPKTYRCEVKFSGISDHESFSDRQVEDYIVDKILLGDEDEVHE